MAAAGGGGSLITGKKIVDAIKGVNLLLNEYIENPAKGNSEDSLINYARFLYDKSVELDIINKYKCPPPPPTPIAGRRPDPGELIRPDFNKIIDDTLIIDFVNNLGIEEHGTLIKNLNSIKLNLTLVKLQINGGCGYLTFASIYSLTIKNISPIIPTRDGEIPNFTGIDSHYNPLLQFLSTILLKIFEKNLSIVNKYIIRRKLWRINYTLLHFTMEKGGDIYYNLIENDSKYVFELKEKILNDYLDGVWLQSFKIGDYFKNRKVIEFNKLYQEIKELKKIISLCVPPRETLTSSPILTPLISTTTLPPPYVPIPSDAEEDPINTIYMDPEELKLEMSISEWKETIKTILNEKIGIVLINGNIYQIDDNFKVSLDGVLIGEAVYSGGFLRINR